MKFKTIVMSTALIATAATLVHAEAPAQEDSLAYNVGLVSEYRYRGLSQTGLKPAVQGGVDFTSASGFYAGAWGSSISWIKDSSITPQAKGPVELDLFGGYRGNLADDLAFDIGGLEYDYVGNTLSTVPGAVNANTFEVYLALTKGAFTAKVSDSTTNLFGFANSKGSRYLDLSYTFDLGEGLTLVPHLGDQYVANNPVSYSDYALTLNKEVGEGLSFSAAVIGTNFKSRHGLADQLPGSGTKDLGASTLVVGVKKAF